VKPFQAKRMKRDVLNVLIRKSKVIELESDENPFSHRLDQLDELGIEQNNFAAINDQQYFYNKIKSQSGKVNSEAKLSAAVTKTT
jgi:hypothetical protein